MANPFTSASAPSTNPAMNLIAPELGTQQAQLLRQQQIAALLRQQSLENDGGTESIGGWAIKKSPYAALGKLAQALAGNYLDDKNDARQLEINKASGEALAKALGGGGMSQATPQIENRVDQNAVGPQPAVDVPSAQTDGASGSSNNFALAKLLQGQAISTVGGSAAGTAFWDQFKTSPEAIRARELGVGLQDQRKQYDAEKFKSGYIAPVNARPGSILRDPTTNLPIAFNPHIPDGFAPGFDTKGNVTSINPIQGAIEAVTAGSAAKAIGSATVDPAPQTYGADNKPNPLQSKREAFAPQTLPGNKSPMSARPGDSSKPDILQSELNKAQARLANPAQYMSPDELRLDHDMSQFKARAQSDIQGIQREMGRGGIAPEARGTQVPQLGAVANSDAAQKASAQTMHDSYAKLQAGNSTAQAALDALDKMQAIAAKKNPYLTGGKIGTMQTAINSEAAEYEKQRANLIAQLAQQNGTGGTDAGRALTGESVPDFGKPKAAIADGLGTLKNQTVAQQIKSTFLTPHFQGGDSKTYTALENQFDRNISPSMVPILTAQPGPARAAQLQAAAKDPAMRARLEWAAQHGLLK